MKPVEKTSQGIDLETSLYTDDMIIVDLKSIENDSAPFLELFTCINHRAKQARQLLETRKIQSTHKMRETINRPSLDFTNEKHKRREVHG